MLASRDSTPTANKITAPNLRPGKSTLGSQGVGKSEDMKLMGALALIQLAKTEAQLQEGQLQANNPDIDLKPARDTPLSLVLDPHLKYTQL